MEASTNRWWQYGNKKHSNSVLVLSFKPEWALLILLPKPIRLLLSNIASTGIRTKATMPAVCTHSVGVADGEENDMTSVQLQWENVLPQHESVCCRKKLWGTGPQKGQCSVDRVHWRHHQHHTMDPVHFFASLLQCTKLMPLRRNFGLFFFSHTCSV